MKLFKSRIIPVILILSILFPQTALLSSCQKKAEAHGKCNIRAAVIGSGSESDDIFDCLTNGIMANISVTKITDTEDIDIFDIIYIAPDAETADTSTIEEYVKKGGTVVLDNSYVNIFDNDFIGAEEVVKLDFMPFDMSYEYTGENLTQISELLYDYTSTLRAYENFTDYWEYDYGYGIVPSTAKVIGGKDGIGIYTKNSYGKGDVFLTNPMLPSNNSVTVFGSGNDKEPMAFSTIGAQRLLLGYYAEYVSKKKYGFSVERTFGSFATKTAAWELHYEDITGIKNKSLIDFADYCKENNQIPSFTLVRNAYTWFKRAESISYLKYDGGFKNDSYENAYCSGTHIVSAGEWLELDSYDNTDSYFYDNPEYTKRAYPFLTDWNEDGNTDIICGSADGKIYYFEGHGMKTNYETGVAAYFTDEDGNALDVGAYSSPAIYDIDGDGKGELITGAEDGVIRAYRSLKTEENPNSTAFSYIGEVLNTGLCDSMISFGYLNDDNIADLAVGSRTGEMRVYYGYTEDGKNTLFGDYTTVETNEQWVSPCIYDGNLFSGTLEGYVACYYCEDGVYKKGEYLTADTASRRGNNRITIGMNSVPRFYDIDGDGDDDLICGNLEYGMAYPIDSEYFPYADELNEQLEYCRKNNLYVGFHGLTHKYASPAQEAEELEYHKSLFETLGLETEGLGINQHTWFTSCYGSDGSGINGYNPDYDGTFSEQSRAGILWNSGSTLPESDTAPQNCAENAIPMPVYLSGNDFLLLEPCNTPHGDGTHSYTSVKYEMPLLFYNHCDYMYEDESSQKKVSDKVGKLTDKYGYMFVREDQLAKAVAASYNSEVRADCENGVITLSSSTVNYGRLHDEDYEKCIGVKIVFEDGEKASEYTTDADVYHSDKNKLSLSLGKTVTVKKGKNNNIHIKGINIPANVKNGRTKASVDFKDGGMMSVRVSGTAVTDCKGWKTETKDGDTIFTKFGNAEKLKIKKT